MFWKREIWPRLGVLLALTMALSGGFGAQAQSSVSQPVMGGDDSSKELKLKGPMGVFQLPRRSVRVPKAIRSLLPRGAKVRLVQRLTLATKDTLVVYDKSDPAQENPLIDIRFPAGLVVREGQVVGRFSLRARSSDDPDWVFLEAGEIRLSPERSGIALSFRSMGDGSVSLFLVIASEGEGYRTILKKTAGEGRLRADQEANLELWDANFGDECEWCNHRYTIWTYGWNGSRLAPTRKTKTCRELDPDAMTDTPIEGVKESIEAEYVQSERRRRQEQRLLRTKLPSGLDGIYRGKLGHQEIVMAVGGARAERWDRCDLRDPTRKHDKRYPIVGRFFNRQNGIAVALAGRPLDANKIYLHEFHQGRPSLDAWKLSVRGDQAVGIRCRAGKLGSTLCVTSKPVSLKRISPYFDSTFADEDGFNPLDLIANDQNDPYYDVLLDSPLENSAEVRINGEIGYVMQRDPRFGVSLPRITRFPVAKVMSEVNQILSRELNDERKAAAECLFEAGRFKGFWRQESRVALFTRKMLSIDRKKEYRCWAGIGYYSVEPLIFNLHDGKFFRVEEFFQGETKYPISNWSVGNEHSIFKPLMDVYLKYYRKPKGGCDPEDIKLGNLLTFYFSQRALMVIPDAFPECRTEVAIPYFELRSLVRGDSPFRSLVDEVPIRQSLR